MSPAAPFMLPGKFHFPQNIVLISRRAFALLAPLPVIPNYRPTRRLTCFWIHVTNSAAAALRLPGGVAT